MTTLPFPSKPSPVEPEPSEVLARLASTSPAHLYQREKRESETRNRPKVEAAKAQLAAIHAQLRSEEQASKRGGRPRKGIGAGVNVVATPRKSRAKPTGRPARPLEAYPPEPADGYVHGRARYDKFGCRCRTCVAGAREYASRRYGALAKGKAA